MTDSEPRGAHPTTLVRGGAALLAGGAVAVSVTPALGLATGLLAGWAALAVTGLVWTLVMIWPMDAAQTRSHAGREDPGRRIAGIITTIGSLASLAAIGVVLIEARDKGPAVEFWMTGIAALSAASSWALIQLDYMLRVAAVYYAQPIGGIDFNQDADPMYTDFAYFAVGLAMTYQVADTNLQTNELRRIVIAQTLLAYLFGAVILATVINLVTSLG